MFDYPVVLMPDDNGTVLVTFPDVPEAITFGADEEESLMRAVDALETALSMYVEARQPLPLASPADGRPVVCPSALECAKLGVYQAMTEQGIKKAELARRLGWHLPQVDRLFNLKHASRLDQIEAAARALGRHGEGSGAENLKSCRSGCAAKLTPASANIWFREEPDLRLLRLRLQRGALPVLRACTKARRASWWAGDMAAISRMSS